MPLSRATSRTRTGNTPIAATVAHVEGSAGLDELYAGPATLSAASPFTAGDIGYLPRPGAVQIRASGSPGAPHSATVVLDLGTERDVSRVELYGNWLLPPLTRGGRSVTNFGLPFGIGVAVIEDFDLGIDLHGLPYYDVWQNEAGSPWHTRLLRTGLRSLWGWTPLPLPPTYGRFLLLHLFDFPTVFPAAANEPRLGIDIQRLYAYPFADDVAHRPQIECAPIASWQTRFSGSRYWSGFGIDDPDPETHQSVFRDEQGRMYLPSALASMPYRDPGPKPVPLYSSDIVRPDSEDRVALVLEATADEIPLISGVALLFDETGALPNYRVRIDTTDDPDAAHSSSLRHPSWAMALEPTIVRAAGVTQPFSTRLVFPDARRARYVRLVVEVLGVPGLDPQRARFVLSALTLLRPRDFVVAPEPGEAYTIDYAVLRVRGRDLASDYAFVDGANGAGLTLEVRDGEGTWQQIQTFRTLLDIVENTQNRLIANPRYPERHRQVIRETSSSDHSGYQSSWSAAEGWSQGVIRPEYGNYQISRSGSITTHTDRPAANMATPLHLSSLPAAPLDFLLTERHYMDPAHLTQSITDVRDAVRTMFATTPGSLDDVASRADAVIGAAENLGPPVTVSLGSSLGLGVSGGPGSINVGASVGASLQVGGGLTRTKVRGDQGAVVQSETLISGALSAQDTSSGNQSWSTDAAVSNDHRTVERTEETLGETRRTGTSVRYNGVDADLLLVAIPLHYQLQGPVLPASPPEHPVPPRDVLRLRVDHLPRGVTLDVEFRGTMYPLGDGR